MTAKAGVRLEVDKRKAQRDMKDFSRTAEKDLERVRAKGAAATAALSKGNAGLAASTRGLRDQIKPLGEGMESLNMALGNTGNKAAMVGGAFLRLAAGPMGAMTAAIGLATVGVTMLLGKQAEAAQKLEERISKLKESREALDKLVMSVQPIEIRAQTELNRLLKEQNELVIEQHRLHGARQMGSGAGTSGMGIPSGMRVPGGRSAASPSLNDPMFLNDEGLRKYAASLVATQGELLKTSANFQTLQQILVKLGVSGRTLDVVNDEIARLISPTTNANLDAASGALERMREDFDALDDPIRQITLKYERMFDAIRAGLPVDRLLTESQRERLAVLRDMTNELAFGERQRREQAQFDAYWADISRFANEETDRRDAENRRNAEFVDKYWAKQAGKGGGAYGSPLENLSTTPFGLKPPPGKDYSQIGRDLGSDLSGNIKSSVSDALFDGMRTGFQNSEQILDSFFASFQRAMMDAVAAGMTQAMGLDADSIAGAFTGIFGGGSDGTNSAGSVT